MKIKCNLFKTILSILLCFSTIFAGYPCSAHGMRRTSLENKSLVLSIDWSESKLYGDERQEYEITSEEVQEYARSLAVQFERHEGYEVLQKEEQKIDEPMKFPHLLVSLKLTGDMEDITVMLETKTNMGQEIALLTSNYSSLGELYDDCGQLVETTLNTLENKIAYINRAPYSRPSYFFQSNEYIDTMADYGKLAGSIEAQQDLSAELKTEISDYRKAYGSRRTKYILGNVLTTVGGLLVVVGGLVIERLLDVKTSEDVEISSDTTRKAALVSLGFISTGLIIAIPGMTLQANNAVPKPDGIIDHYNREVSQTMERHLQQR